MSVTSQASGRYFFAAWYQYKHAARELSVLWLYETSLPTGRVCELIFKYAFEPL